MYSIKQDKHVSCAVLFSVHMNVLFEQLTESGIGGRLGKQYTVGLSMSMTLLSCYHPTRACNLSYITVDITLMCLMYNLMDQTVINL